MVVDIFYFLGQIWLWLKSERELNKSGVSGYVTIASDRISLQAN
jgi:hypothetical protein